MARSFSSSTDLVQSTGAYSSGFLTPVDRSFTYFGLLQRTGARDFAIILACAGESGGGWLVSAGSGADNTKFGLVLRAVSEVGYSQTLTLNTTMAIAVRWEDGVRVDYWTQAEGAGSATKTGVATSSTVTAPGTPTYDIVHGNNFSGSGNSLGFPGTIQFGGIVEGLCTDTEVTDTLAALLAGDFSVPAGFDDRFWMSLSPGGVATSPEDDTSPNNQDSSTITGTSAVADLIAASGGGASVAPSDVPIALAVEAPTVTYTGPASVTPSDVALALSVEAPAASASSPASVSDAVLALVAESPAITYTPPSGGALPSDAPIALAVEAPSLGYTPPNFTTAPTDEAMALAVEAPAVTYRPKYTVAVADIAFALAVEDPAATFTESSGTPRTPKTFTAPARRNTFTVPEQ